MLDAFQTAAVGNGDKDIDAFVPLYDFYPCLLYTSDAADERSSVDLGGRRIIKKKKNRSHTKNTINIIRDSTTQQRIALQQE